jgi:hypothetical protein
MAVDTRIETTARKRSTFSDCETSRAAKPVIPTNPAGGLWLLTKNQARGAANVPKPPELLRKD